ncbi:Cytochrome P450 monooxygenase trt6 [Colletotrichum tropicale]|nr:Cytochrome P450 monooxygenase trt6 [Colletotrichum tropicale]
METLRQLIAATPHGFLPTIVIGLISLFSLYVRDGKPFSGFQLIGKEPGEWFNTAALKRWEEDPLKLIKEGFKATAGRPFQVMTESGPLIMIPLDLADEIRNDPRLTFAGFLERQQLTIYPGLDALHLSTKEEIIQETIRKHLTQALGGLTQRLSDEAAAVLDEGLPTGNGEWQHIQFYMTAAQAAARLSALTFLGEELCHNPEWIDISISFTGVALHSGNSLRAWPAILRPFVHHFLPELWYIKGITKKARAIILPELERRRAARSTSTKPQDSLSWLDDVRGDRDFDIVKGQLFLTFAAIHTTSSVLTALLYDLINNPKYFDLLREEIAQVLREDGGWKKTSLYKMKLMDSCMKESQRLNILGHHMMNRRVEAPITLSDGTYLPRGVHLGVPVSHMRDSEFLGESPDQFDGHRFLRMRQQPGQENKWQFVTTSPHFLSFGHGKHACPGRFFASNEIKIILCHLIMKYDWSYENEPPRSAHEHRFVPDPQTVILYKKRAPEIQL